MLKCHECEAEKETLYSVDRPQDRTDLYGKALCKACAKAELQKQKRPFKE